MVKKHILDCEPELWKKVHIFKLENNCKDVNEAVIKLIKKGLRI